MGEERYNERNELLIYNCPVCGSLAFHWQGCFETCPTCNWMDDPIQAENPDEDLCANFVSLNQAREDWKNGKAVEN